MDQTLYLVVGINCVGGDGFVMPRVWEPVIERFWAGSDSEARRIAAERFSTIRNSKLFRQVS